MTYLAVRLVTLVAVRGPTGAALAAAAATEGNNGIRLVIISGAFSVVVALIGAAALLVRHSRPDLTELLELHERIAVLEANQADVRELAHGIDQRTTAILRKLGQHEHH